MKDGYKDFVWALASDETKDFQKFINRLIELDQDCSINTALHAAMGMAEEAGEAAGIIKKAIFQGKPIDKHMEHLKKELGDVIFYWTLSCRALGFDPEDVINENVSKLSARYPEGTFDSYFSENRKNSDV